MIEIYSLFFELFIKKFFFEKNNREKLFFCVDEKLAQIMYNDNQKTLSIKC